MFLRQREPYWSQTTITGSQRHTQNTLAIALLMKPTPPSYAAAAAADTDTAAAAAATATAAAAAAYAAAVSPTHPVRGKEKPVSSERGVDDGVTVPNPWLHSVLMRDAIATYRTAARTSLVLAVVHIASVCVAQHLD